MHARISRDAWPAPLRRSKKSACSVRLSGLMAAPMIDPVAGIFDGIAVFWGRASFGIALAAIWLVGCAESRYIYRPAQQATATVGNLPAARYAIPAERPTGEVLIASPGLTAMPEADGRTPALFVRMVVTNNSDDTPWTVDTRQQFAFIGGEKQSPSFVNGAKPQETALQIPRGEKKLVDLYYPLPAKIEGDEQIPQFELAWTVATPSRAIAERTAFDRLRIEPYYYDGGYYAYGPYWRRDPFWYPYPYYGGVYLGVGHYGHYGHYGYGGGGYGRHFGGRPGGYIRATPGRR
jgi:hypothetical protein